MSSGQEVLEVLEGRAALAVVEALARKQLSWAACCCIGLG